jgi:peroxiredoxin
MPEVGQRAPEIAAIDESGARRTLGDLAGERGLVLLFYRGAW